MAYNFCFGCDNEYDCNIKNKSTCERYNLSKSLVPLIYTEQVGDNEMIMKTRFITTSDVPRKNRYISKRSLRISKCNNTIIDNLMHLQGD